MCVYLFGTAALFVFQSTTGHHMARDASGHQGPLQVGALWLGKGSVF